MNWHPSFTKENSCTASFLTIPPLRECGKEKSTRKIYNKQLHTSNHCSLSSVSCSLEAMANSSWFCGAAYKAGRELWKIFQGYWSRNIPHYLLHRCVQMWAGSLLLKGSCILHRVSSQAGQGKAQQQTFAPELGNTKQWPLLCQQLFHDLLVYSLRWKHFNQSRSLEVHQLKRGYGVSSSRDLQNSSGHSPVLPALSGSALQRGWTCSGVPF